MFTVGTEYHRRTDIHGRFGGQQQGGISTPTSAPYLFIFTGGSGTRFGYEDGWHDGDIFLFTGEGQIGDMEFRAGNRAIRDHARDGKDILLFEADRKAWVSFVGRFHCPSWEYGVGPDRNGDTRKTIQFHLVRLDLEVDETPTPSVSASAGKSLTVLRERAFAACEAAETPMWREARQRYRERSAAVREYVLARAGGRCESPDCRVLSFQRADHHTSKRITLGGCRTTAPMTQDGSPRLAPQSTAKYITAWRARRSTQPYRRN